MELKLDRKTTILSIVGMTVVGAFLFFAGMLVAIWWYLPDHSSEAGEALPLESDRPETAGPSSAPRAPTLSPSMRPVNPQLRQPRVTAPRVSGSMVSSRAASRAIPASEPAQEPMPGQEIEPQTAAQEDLSQAPVFSVQVGAFLSDRSLDPFLRDLERRGYEPYVVKVTSANQSVLYAVRIGRYATREEAVQAAAEIFNNEGLKAVVRPASTY